MHVAIGEGRAVVQDEFLAAEPAPLDLAVKLGGIPFLEAGGFARDEVGLHGEVRARKVQCIFVFHCKIEGETVTAGKCAVNEGKRLLKMNT